MASNLKLYGQFNLPSAQEKVAVPIDMIRHVTLQATVTSGEHFPKMDQMGTCDPYCTIQWAGQRFETEVKCKTYDPVWNQEFSFKAVDLRGQETKGLTQHTGMDLTFNLGVFDYNSATSSDHVGSAQLPHDAMEQIMFAPDGWTTAAVLSVSQSGSSVTGNDHEPTVVRVEITVSWTQEKDTSYVPPAEAPSAEDGDGAEKGVELPKKVSALERAQREREEEHRERAERAQSRMRAGPTFFGGGRLGNALQVEAAARNGENWSKRNAIVLNSDKAREAKLRALAAAETRRLGSSGRRADQENARLVVSVLASGSMQVGQALRDKGLLHSDSVQQETLAAAAMQRRLAWTTRGRLASGRSPSHITSLPCSKSGNEEAAGAGAARCGREAETMGRTGLRLPPFPFTASSAVQPTAAQTAPRVLGHREGLLTTADDLDRYARMNKETEERMGGGDGRGGSEFGDSLAEVRGFGESQLGQVRPAETGVKSSSLLCSPRAAEGYRLREDGGGVEGRRDADGDALLARARALIDAGQAVSSALAGMPRPAGSQASGRVAAQRWGGEGYRDGGHVAWCEGGNEGGFDGEMHSLAEIRGIAQSILGSSDKAGRMVAEEEEEEVEQQALMPDTSCWSMLGRREEALEGRGNGMQNTDSSFGTRLKELEEDYARRRKGSAAGAGGWGAWTEVEAGGDGGAYDEAATPTCPSVRSGPDSDLSEGIPVGRCCGVGGGGCEEEGEEQRVVLEGIRLRGQICGTRDDPHVTFVVKIDIGGVKSRTNKERCIRGEVAWRDRCELDVIGARASSTLRLRVLRCRQSQTSSQSVDSVVGSCEIQVDRLEGSDRTVSWGWHRVAGAHESGEIYLGIERSRVHHDDFDGDAAAAKESRGTMPDEVLAPMLDDPATKAGGAAMVQRAYRCHLARRSARATLLWKQSLQRQSHRPAFPGSLEGLRPPEKQTQAAASSAADNDNVNNINKGAQEGREQKPRDGAAGLYGLRRAAAPKSVVFAAQLPGTGTGGEDGARRRSRDWLLDPFDRQWQAPQSVYSDTPSASTLPNIHKGLDALFPLGKVSRSAFRMPATVDRDPVGGIGGMPGPWAGGHPGHMGHAGGGRWNNQSAVAALLG